MKLVLRRDQKPALMMGSPTFTLDVRAEMRQMFLRSCESNSPIASFCDEYGGAESRLFHILSRPAPIVNWTIDMASVFGLIHQNCREDFYR